MICSLCSRTPRSNRAPKDQWNYCDDRLFIPKPQQKSKHAVDCLHLNSPWAQSPFGIAPFPRLLHGPAFLKKLPCKNRWDQKPRNKKKSCKNASAMHLIWHPSSSWSWSKNVVPISRRLPPLPARSAEKVGERVSEWMSCITSYSHTWPDPDAHIKWMPTCTMYCECYFSVDDTDERGNREKWEQSNCVWTCEVMVLYWTYTVSYWRKLLTYARFIYFLICGKSLRHYLLKFCNLIERFCKCKVNFQQFRFQDG